MMADNNFILDESNRLAHTFFQMLTSRKDETIKFWESKEEVEVMCWDLAVESFKALKQVDPNDYIPVEVNEFDGLSFYERVREQAASDGTKSKWDGKI